MRHSRTKRHSRQKSLVRRVKREKKVKNPFDKVDNVTDIDMSNDKLFQDLIGLSGDRMADLFQKAASFLQQQRYEESVKSFRLMIQLNPYISECWLGLGLSFKLQGNAQEALSAYMMAITLDPYRIEAYQHAVECCIELGKFELAQSVVQEGYQHHKTYAKKEEKDQFYRSLHEVEAVLKKEKEFYSSSHSFKG